MVREENNDHDSASAGETTYLPCELTGPSVPTDGRSMPMFKSYQSWRKAERGCKGVSLLPSMLYLLF